MCWMLMNLHSNGNESCERKIVEGREIEKKVVCGTPKLLLSGNFHKLLSHSMKKNVLNANCPCGFHHAFCEPHLFP